MAKRLIDSSILSSSDFVDLGLKERWLWLGMCLICDDYGWCNADIGYLKNRIAPSVRMSRAHIERSLCIFEERLMIVRCTFGQVKALRLLNFNYFNKLKRRRPSKYEKLAKRREEKEKNSVFRAPEALSAEGNTFIQKLLRNQEDAKANKAKEL